LIVDRYNTEMVMKSCARLVAALGCAVALAGCDNILGLDNYDAPNATLTGRVVFEGQPVGVRSSGVQLELWQPGYALNQKIPVHVAQDGTFSASLFDGSYRLNLLRGNGPWESTTDTITVEVRGQTAVDVPVRPYYVIRNEQVAFNPTGGGPHGTIDATFNVGQVNTAQALEYVGLYVGTTTFVDRNNSVGIPNAERERLRAAILPQLESNGTIGISVRLPENIYLTGSPARREHVFVRIGVKTVGVAEMLFSPVHKVAI
jgi:hypothetical protein